MKKLLSSIMPLLLLAAGCASVAGKSESGAVAQTPIKRIARDSQGPSYVPQSSAMSEPAAMRPMALGDVVSASPLAGDKPAPWQVPFGAPPESDRKIVYTASLRLLVAEVDAARAALEEIARASGGFILRESLTEIVFRVPSARFQESLGAVDGLGEILGRDIHSDDVTDQYIDLDIRIKVAEEEVQRLKELLKTSNDVKELLEVEREIHRLTEEVERMKGGMRVLSDKIELATITVALVAKGATPTPTPTPTPPPPRPRTAAAFDWMRDLGVEPVLDPPVPLVRRRSGPIDALVIDPVAGASSYLWRQIVGPPFRLAADGGAKLPEGFIPALDEPLRIVGLTPQDYRLRARVIELKEEAAFEFWSKAVELELSVYRGCKVETVAAPEGPEGLRCAAFRCETAFRSEPWLYDVWLIQQPDDRRRILAVEFARAKKEEGDPYLPKVERAIAGARLR